MLFCLSLILEISQALLLHIFLSLSRLLLEFPLCICYTICNCPTALRYSVPLVSFFYSYFYGLEVSFELSSSSLIIYLTMSSLLMHPSMAFFISVEVFLIYRISFDSLLKFLPLFLHCLCFLECCLHFSLEPFIYCWLYSWLFKILALLIPITLPYLDLGVMLILPLHTVIFASHILQFFVESWHDVLVNKNCGKWFINMKFLCLTSSWVVLTVCCSYSFSEAQISLGFLVFVSLVLGFSRASFSNKVLALQFFHL